MQIDEKYYTDTSDLANYTLWGFTGIITYVTVFQGILLPKQIKVGQIPVLNCHWLTPSHEGDCQKTWKDGEPGLHRAYKTSVWQVFALPF